MDSPTGSQLKIVSSSLLHIADRSFYLGPFANQRDLDAGADMRGRYPPEERTQFLEMLLNEHDTPAKTYVSSARQQLEDLWPKWIAGKYGDVDTESDAGQASGEQPKTVAGRGSSARCNTPPGE